MKIQMSCLAIDIGASSGSIVLGVYDGVMLSFKTLYSFSNSLYATEEGVFWNIEDLYNHIVKGLSLIALEGIELKSVGIDTWAVDYLVVSELGAKQNKTFSYRDDRTKNVLEKFFKTYDRFDIYKKTGIQIQRFNTLFQLYVDKTEYSPKDTFLMIPDYLHYALTGIFCNEKTNISTTQLFSNQEFQLQSDLLSKTLLQKTNFPQLVSSGDFIGYITEERLKNNSQIFGLPVIVPTTHDTASAICAIPCETDETPLYISSGTWTLMGVELDAPIINKKSFELNFTNEAGHGDSICFLKNIMGLWLFQELKKDFPHYTSFNEMEVDAAQITESFRTLINPQDETFFNPRSMKSAIDDYCKKNNEPIPLTPAHYIRSVYESLCLSFKITKDEIEELTGKPYSHLYIIGGGSKDAFLCQQSANILGIPVVAGPAEATAIGNCLVQFAAHSIIPSLAEGRKILKQSMDIKTYFPIKMENEDVVMSRFMQLCL